MTLEILKCFLPLLSRPLLLTLPLLTLPLGITSARAAETTSGATCDSLFQASSAPPEMTEKIVAQLARTPKKRYLVTRLNDDRPAIGTYAGSTTHDGVFLIRFQILNSRESVLANPMLAALSEAPVQFDVANGQPASQNASQASPLRQGMQELQDLKLVFSRANDVMRDFGNIMYQPRQQVFKNQQLEIYGDFGSKQHRADGAAIGRILTQFDDSLEQAGFRLPKKTIVHVRSSRYAKKMNLGPYCFLRGLWSPWRGHSDMTMSLLPFGEESAIVTSPSVLAHERTHSMLASTYRPDAFFNRETAQSLQEAIADFLAAHFTDSPVVGGEVSVARDLSKSLPGARGGLPVTRNLFRTDQFLSQYHNSLAYSGILWRLREALGAKRITADLKGILDALAAIGGPYTFFISSTALEIEHGNMQHFLRTLARFYRADATAMRVIEDVAAANLFTLDGLNPSRMANPAPLANGLASRNVRPPTAVAEMAAATLRITLPPAAIGSIFYFVLFQDDDE